MSETVKLLAFAGSARADSFNKKLVKVAADGAREAGAEVTYVDFADYPLAIINLDDEKEYGAPENALKLKKLMSESDGYLIASPEHNGALSALLKNVIDWTSRKSEGDASVECYNGKVAILMSASPGGLGGIRGLNYVRAILSGMGVIVLPDQIAVSGAGSAFDDSGDLIDEKKRARVLGLGATLVKTVAKLKA